MKKTPRKNAGTFDERFKPYRKTPFDREEKPRITFDLNDKTTARERQDEESRRNLFMHRWREEQAQKHRQQKQHRNRKNQMQPKTWRDVIREPRPGEYHH